MQIVREKFDYGAERRREQYIPATKNALNKGVRDESVVKSIPFASSYHVNVIIKLLFASSVYSRFNRFDAKKQSFSMENAKNNRVQAQTHQKITFCNQKS
jgi:hypothetical protein